MPLVVYYILFMDDLKTGVLAIRINEGLEDDALVALNAKSKTGKKKNPHWLRLSRGFSSFIIRGSKTDAATSLDTISFQKFFGNGISKNASQNLYSLSL